MLDEEDDEIEVPIKSKKSSGSVGKKTTASEVFQKIDSMQNKASNTTEDDLIFDGNEDYSSDSLFTSINDAKKTQEDLYSALNQINSKPKRKKRGFLGLF